MKNILEYVGKCLLIKTKKVKILVIGDLHLGYEGSLRQSGIMVPVSLSKQVMEDFEKIISKIGVVDKIIILGDVKHEFGKILKEEWNGITNFLEHVKNKCKELIVIEGNHDKILNPILKKLEIVGKDYFIWENFCFFHGDKSFEIINSKKIKYWIIGHGHPAINLQDEIKKEKYKCFLIGKYKKKNIIIVPSFFPLFEGTDPRDFNLGLFKDFELNNFEVKIVGENLEVLNFGKLGKI